MSNTEQKELVDAMFTALAKLSRHRYFLDELWTKIGKWDHNDRADVHAAFVSKCIYERTGLPIYPMGMSWSYIGDAKHVEEYHAEYNDLWDDYIKWCNDQR